MFKEQSQHLKYCEEFTLAVGIIYLFIDRLIVLLIFLYDRGKIKSVSDIT